MNRVTIVVLLMVATGMLATGAQAQKVEMFQITIAREFVPEELFGGGAVKLEFEDIEIDETTNEVLSLSVGATPVFAPMAGLNMRGTILPGTEFEVTYTLSNATFAEPVSNADIFLGKLDPDPDGRDNIPGTADDRRSFRTLRADPNLVTLEREGGGKNTKSVTFGVVVHSELTYIPRTQDPITRQRSGEEYYFFFALPDVNATDLRAPDPGSQRVLLRRLLSGRNVGLETTVSQRKSGGAGSIISESVATSSFCDPMVGCPLVGAFAAIADIANTPGGGLISLELTDARSVLVGTDGEASSPQRAPLATVQLTPSEDFDVYRDLGWIRDQDGDIVDGFTGDLAGNLVIEVSSDSFNSGDVVYIDANANGEADGREAFDMGESVASDTVPLGEEPLTVYYVPSGDSALSHRAAFTTTARTEFSNPDNRVRSSEPATAELKLHGIGDRVAKAYAIAPLDSDDMSNVRVTCETSAKTGCNVFLDCKDQAGVNTFGEAGAMVGPQETARWNQMAIAAALGLEESWEGRLACDVLSSAPISVQVLTRSAGVLANNTDISEGGR